MNRFSYSVARKDFEALERIAELHDQVELDAERLYLMQDPTKARASRMYQNAIELWFQEHGILTGSEAIAERHSIRL